SSCRRSARSARKRSTRKWPSVRHPLRHGRDARAGADGVSRSTLDLDWSQPLATAAGLRMLARGGNAVDAALATAITLTVVEPCSNGAGSDLFAILWDGRQLVGLNASGRSPAAW